MRDKRKEYGKRKRSRFSYSRSFTRTALSVDPNQDLEDYDDVFNPYYDKKYGSGSWFQTRFDRWLRAQVGRKWDDIYSDISKIFDHRTHNFHDFKKSLRWLVRIDTHVADDGSILTNEHRWYNSLRNQLYVHPVTGILCYNGVRNRYHWSEICDDEKEINLIRISPVFEYEKIKGQWYSMTYRMNDPDRVIYQNFQNGMLVKFLAKFASGFEPKTLVKKHQLSHDEIRRLRKEHFSKGLNKKYTERTKRETPVMNLI